MATRKCILATFVILFSVLLLSAGSVFGGQNITDAGAPFTIQSLNSPSPEFIDEGDTVLVSVTGPSTASGLFHWVTT